MLEAITAAAAEGWTLAICSPERGFQAAVALLFDSCSLCAGSIAELLALPLPDHGRLLVICGDRLPDGGADTLIEELQQRLGAQRLQVLVILPRTVSQERLERIWQSGVAALVCRQNSGDGQLLRAVLQVLRGQSVLDPGLRRRLQHCDTSGAMDPAGAIAGPEVMTAQDRELLLAVARGHSSATIAALHQVRSDSVRRSLSHLYRKVGVRNQRGLIAWGLEQGLLRPPDLRPPHRSGESDHSTVRRGSAGRD